MLPTEIRRVHQEVRDAVSRVVVLADPGTIDLILVCLMCRGHILLDDIPGVGKTLLARTMARVLGLDFRRVQFTPDLLPSDITGINFFDQKAGDFRFRPGPVFTNILLADEINRATPRTQASLLEAMQEGTVSVDGVTHPLAEPFMVIATQNPVELEGTFPLPEAQLDRFFMRLSLGYPSQPGELEIIQRFLNKDPLADARPATEAAQFPAMLGAPAAVRFAPPVLDYLIELCRATRAHEGVRLGASPRATLHLARAAQALAAIRGREYVLPDDVQEVAGPVLGHRLIMDLEAAYLSDGDGGGAAGAGVVAQLLKRVPVPIGESGVTQR